MCFKHSYFVLKLRKSSCRLPEVNSVIVQSPLLFMCGVGLIIQVKNVHSFELLLYN